MYSPFRTSHLGTNANHFKKAVTHHTKNKRPQLRGRLIIILTPRGSYVALSALRASWAAFFSRYFSSVRLCQPTQLSVGDRPHVHALIAIASKVFALNKQTRRDWLIGLLIVSGHRLIRVTDTLTRWVVTLVTLMTRSSRSSGGL